MFAARMVGVVVVGEEVLDGVGGGSFAALVVGVVVVEGLLMGESGSWSELMVVTLVGRFSFLNLPNLSHTGRGLLLVCLLSWTLSGLELLLTLGEGVAVGV